MASVLWNLQRSLHGAHRPIRSRAPPARPLRPAARFQEVEMEELLHASGDAPGAEEAEAGYCVECIPAPGAPPTLVPAGGTRRVRLVRGEGHGVST